MARTRIKLNRRGVRDLLRSEPVRKDMERRARNIAESAGPGHEASSVVGRNRARASVITTTREARLAESRSGRLSGAVNAGSR